MRLLAARHLVSLLVALMLALGAGAHGAQAASTGGKMEASAPMAMPAFGSCQDCGGDDERGMAMDACFALCAGTIALPTGFVAAVDPVAERLTATVAAAGIGHFGPPDPFPPRSIVLS